MSSALPRVVLVEDDAAMQLYVQTAVQHLPIELICCATVDQAWQALHDGGARLLITDLMLGRESGLSLIERVRAGPMPLRSTPVAVTSAATDAPGVRERLLDLNVWRFLRKPVGLRAIEACVRDALQDTTPAARSDGSQGRTSPAEPRRDLEADHAAAVMELFGGDGSLYGHYLEACLLQFPNDIAEGDAGFERNDTAGIRRLAHNLRSVLHTLGEPTAARHAEQLEATILAADLSGADAAWRELRAELSRLLGP